MTYSFSIKNLNGRQSHIGLIIHRISEAWILSYTPPGNHFSGSNNGEVDQMICPKCGFDNPSGSFCGQCGSPLPAQSSPVYQPPTPKRNSNKMLMVAIVAIVIVVAVVLAAVMFVLPKTAQSSPEATMETYFDGAKNHNAAQILDSTVMHFDTANRSLLISDLNSSWSNMNVTNVEIVSSEGISNSNVPADIKLDVTNFTTAVQNAYHITIQESQFQKVTVKWTNSSTDSYTSTSYVLFSKVDVKWYFDIIVSYSVDDWAADRSKSDQGVRYYSSTPTGSFTYGMNNSGYWVFTVGSISSSTLNYTDCKVQLTVGSHVSNAIAIPASLYMTIPIGAENAIGYDLFITDYGTSGYLSRGDFFSIGPINNATGKNAFQPVGTQITLTLIYSSTGEAIATKSFTL